MILNEEYENFKNTRRFDLTEAGIKVGYSSTTVEKFSNNLIIVMGSLIGMFAIMGIITGGIILMTAFGNEEKIQSGKSILLYSVLGLIFTIGAYVIVSFIQTLIYSLGGY